jgi:hypothetical protein
MTARRPDAPGRPLVTASQAVVALPLLLKPVVVGPPWTSWVYYGLVVLLLPLAVEYALGRGLGRHRRLALSVGIGLHIYGLWFFLYPRLWWWDVLTHVVSGAFVAAGGYLLAAALYPERRPRARHLLALGVVVAGGLAWELWEALFVWSTMAGGLKPDTAFDLVADLTGWALVATAYPTIVGDLPEGLRWRIRTLRRRATRSPFVPYRADGEGTGADDDPPTS